MDVEGLWVETQGGSSEGGSPARWQEPGRDPRWPGADDIAGDGGQGVGFQAHLGGRAIRVLEGGVRGASETGMKADTEGRCGNRRGRRPGWASQGPTRLQGERRQVYGPAGLGPKEGERGELPCSRERYRPRMPRLRAGR